jgi:hypothetical protein
VVSYRGNDELSIVLKANESTIEEVADAWRQKQAVFAI